MRELANSFAELAAIIIILVTIAISMAAVAQWAGADAVSGDAQPTQVAGLARG